MNFRKLTALCVHLYTSLGVVCALIAALAMVGGNIRVFLLSLLAAVLIDATDGMLARRYRVGTVLPAIDGRKLDDIIDYLTFAFLPCAGLVVFGVLSAPWAPVAAVPLVASAFGFSNTIAKLEEAFVGFPSYWNLVFLYLYVLPLPQQAVIAVLLILSVLVFVPIRFIYPTKTRWLKRTTLALTWGYGIIIALVCAFPEAQWAETVMWVSLLYPVYYISASIMRHHQQEARSTK